MGMTIEEAIEHGKEQLEIFAGEHKEFIETSIDTMRKYQMMQADYENRLKADLKAILVELQLEIEECVDGAEGSPQFEQGVTIAREQVVKMIQQKINELKGNRNE